MTTQDVKALARANQIASREEALSDVLFHSHLEYFMKETANRADLMVPKGHDEFLMA